MRAPTYMRPAAAIAACILVGACAGTDRGVGATCDTRADCDGDLQCLDHTCQPRCRRAPDCGDGYACTEDGFCVLGKSRSGDRCTSEVECAPGLSCVLDVDDGGDGVLEASCTPDHDGAATGLPCEDDAGCRNGTCAIGQCVDVCAIDRDCASGSVCTTIPRVDNAATPRASLGTFHGCLPSGGTLAWELPTSGTADEVYLPVPGNARSAVAVMSIDDGSQYVGATRLLQPDSTQVYDLDPAVFDPFDPTNAIRHTPTAGTSVMMIPSRPETPLVAGAYLLAVSSFRLVPTPAPHLISGTATPRVTAMVKLGAGTVLDLHFYFLDLSEHPCQAEIGGTLTAATAAAPDSPFQNPAPEGYLSKLRLIFARAGIALGAATYDDLPGHPDLDGLDSENLGDLLALSKHAGGVSVFFVRTIAPVGLEVLVGGDKNPGDPSVGSPVGGVAIGVDELCYRGWDDLARVTAHGIARQMGLFRNVEPAPFGSYEDPISDSPGVDDPTGAATNLMYYSEFGGSTLSDGQQEVLRRSAVLR